MDFSPPDSKRHNHSRIFGNVSLPKQQQFNFELSKHLFCCLQLWNDISSSKVHLQWEAVHVYCIGFNKNNLCGLFEFAMLIFLFRLNNKKARGNVFPFSTWHNFVSSPHSLPTDFFDFSGSELDFKKWLILLTLIRDLKLFEV